MWGYQSCSEGVALRSTRSTSPDIRRLSSLRSPAGAQPTDTVLGTRPAGEQLVPSTLVSRTSAQPPLTSALGLASREGPENPRKDY